MAGDLIRKFKLKILEFRFLLVVENMAYNNIILTELIGWGFGQ